MVENCWYLHCEISCVSVVMRHVQMLKRAAASFVLCAFFFYGGTASYLGGSELLKIWCCVQDICIHPVKCYLNYVRNELKRNSAVPKSLLEGNGSNYIHGWSLKEQKIYASESISKLS